MAYLQDKLTGKDMVMNKLLVKNQALKQGIRKAEGVLKSKDSGDDLQYIDFHQLQIENQQYLGKIEEENQEVIQLKKTSARTLKMLNSMKKRLAHLRFFLGGRFDTPWMEISFSPMVD